METISTVALTLSLTIAAYSAWRLFSRKQITVTRKDNGQSVTISGHPNSNEKRKLLELLNQ